MYTYVTYEAYFKPGKGDFTFPPKKVPLAACFGGLTSHPDLCSELDYLLYTPAIIPGLHFMKANGIQGALQIEFFIPLWIKVLNTIFPGDHFAREGDNWQIKYTVGDSSLGQIKLHLFAMRQAFNHPLIWVFLHAAYSQPGVVWNGDKWWKLLSFLTNLHTTFTGENLIWDETASHSTFSHFVYKLKPIAASLKELKNSSYVHSAVQDFNRGINKLPNMPKLSPSKGMSAVEVFQKTLYPVFEDYEKACDKA